MSIPHNMTIPRVDLGPTGGWTIRRKTCGTCGAEFETTTGLGDCGACRKAEKAARRCSCGKPATSGRRCSACESRKRRKAGYGKRASS